MTCADLEVLLCDYVDGTLEGDRKAAVEQHLAACATCAQFARDISTAVAFAEKAPPVEPPDELVTQILYHVPATRSEESGGWFRGLFGRWLEPVLQPRFAMGMAMTILSFSLLAKFAGIPERQLTPEDLHPAAVWAAVDDRMHRVWDRGVKYYESMKVVFEVQSRLAEWTEEEAPATQPDSEDLLNYPAGLAPGEPVQERDGDERSPAE
jgi:hypothetical protein